MDGKDVSQPKAKEVGENIESIGDATNLWWIMTKRIDAVVNYTPICVNINTKLTNFIK